MEPQTKGGSIMFKIYEQESSSRKVDFSTHDEAGLEIARAQIYLHENRDHPNPYAYLEDVHVDKAYRKNGCGKEIVKRAIRKARELGCYKIILSCVKHNDNAKRLYKDLGFVVWADDLRLDLE